MGMFFQDKHRSKKRAPWRDAESIIKNYEDDDLPNEIWSDLDRKDLVEI